MLSASGLLAVDAAPEQVENHVAGEGLEKSDARHTATLKVTEPPVASGMHEDKNAEAMVFGASCAARALMHFCELARVWGSKGRDLDFGAARRNFHFPRDSPPLVRRRRTLGASGRDE